MLTTCAEDMMQSMGWVGAENVNRLYVPASDVEAEVMGILASQVTHIDSLAEDCSLTVPDLSTILLRLELQGVVEKLPGSRYTIS